MTKKQPEDLRTLERKIIFISEQMQENEHKRNAEFQMEIEELP